MTVRWWALGILVLMGCRAEPEVLRGQVVDIWGNPVPEATVVMEGHDTRPTTDAQGGFTLPLEPGEHRIRAGLEGYIQEHVQVEVVPGEPAPTVTLRLYPEPEENGFYLVGSASYLRLEPQRVHHVGNELKSITGVRAVDTRTEAGPFRVVFHTDRRMDEIVRLDLDLHTLEYTRRAELPGPLGSDEVRVNLWTSTGTLPFDITPMRSANDYLLTTEEALEPGWYAFTTQGLLEPEDGVGIAHVPEELQVAFAFELR